MMTYKEAIEFLRESCGCTCADDVEMCEVWCDECADLIEKLVAELEEKNRILKAVQENSGINFRMWQGAEAVKDELIQRICQHCDSRMELCEECPIAGEIRSVFDDNSDH